MTATTVSLRSLITSTLAARWCAASDAVREWALSRGYARVPEFSAECADAENWSDDWREPNGGSWPTYTLAVNVDGQRVGDVKGWHFVGPWSGRCDGSAPEDWTERDDDGAYSGLPRVAWDDEAGPHVTCEPSGSLGLPRVGEDGRVLAYDEDAIGRAIRRAARSADHGEPPSLANLDPADADREPWSRVYVIRDYRVIVAADVRRITAYQTGTESIGRGRERRSYLLTGYVLVNDDGYPLGEIHDNTDDAISAADPTGDDGKRYLSDCAAEHALEALVRERLEDLDTPEGLSWDFDGIGLFVQPDGLDEKYHLDAEETATACLQGWYAIWDEILSAFSVRETLAARREWSERMDALITERDPFVGLEDSLLAGNCRAESERFARAVCEAEGGEVGAVRASRILAMRDDAYTRRACRMAAQRADR